MSVIEIIYIAASTVSICGSIPQIKQVLQTKRTDELSATTWSIWTGSQVIAMTYAISIHATLLIITNAVWATFYAVMIALIFYYRIPKVSKHVYETVDVAALDGRLQ